jgi:hypothetical protein
MWNPRVYLKSTPPICRRPRRAITCQHQVGNHFLYPEKIRDCLSKMIFSLFSDSVSSDSSGYHPSASSPCSSGCNSPRTFLNAACLSPLSLSDYSTEMSMCEDSFDNQLCAAQPVDATTEFSDIRVEDGYIDLSNIFPSIKLDGEIAVTRMPTSSSSFSKSNDEESRLELAMVNKKNQNRNKSLSGLLNHIKLTLSLFFVKNFQAKDCLHIWEFLRDLLMSSKYNGRIIKWLDQKKGIFKMYTFLNVFILAPFCQCL